MESFLHLPGNMENEESFRIEEDLRRVQLAESRSAIHVLPPTSGLITPHPRLEWHRAR